MKTKFIKIVLLLVLFSFNSCKINQTKNKVKVGRWVYTDTINSVLYKTTGKYKNGIESKKWIYKVNNKIIKKEKYHDNFCDVINYHSNGKIASKGKTKLTFTDSLAHWYYFDKCLFYDEKQKLIETKFYNFGELMN